MTLGSSCVCGFAAGGGGGLCGAVGIGCVTCCFDGAPGEAVDAETRTSTGEAEGADVDADVVDEVVGFGGEAAGGGGGGFCGCVTAGCWASREGDGAGPEATAVDAPEDAAGDAMVAAGGGAGGGGTDGFGRLDGRTGGEEVDALMFTAEPPSASPICRASASSA